jgi:hypothetical protein
MQQQESASKIVQLASSPIFNQESVLIVIHHAQLAQAKLNAEAVRIDYSCIMAPA